LQHDKLISTDPLDHDEQDDGLASKKSQASQMAKARGQVSSSFTLFSLFARSWGVHSNRTLLFLCRPKHPLSAYNIFLRGECSRLMGEKSPSRAATTTDANMTFAPDVSTSRGSSPPLRDGHGNDSGNPSSPTAAATATENPVQSRFLQGVAARWKALDAAAKAEFEEQAQQDRRRYQEELTAWKKQNATETTAKEADEGLIRKVASAKDDAYAFSKTIGLLPVGRTGFATAASFGKDGAGVPQEAQRVRSVVALSPTPPLYSWSPATRADASPALAADGWAASRAAAATPSTNTTNRVNDSVLQEAYERRKWARYSEHCRRDAELGLGEDPYGRCRAGFRSTHHSMDLETLQQELQHKNSAIGAVEQARQQANERLAQRLLEQEAKHQAELHALQEKHEAQLQALQTQVKEKDAVIEAVLKASAERLSGMTSKYHESQQENQRLVREIVGLLLGRTSAGRKEELVTA
jgi:HMG (high mobility group) box